MKYIATVYKTIELQTVLYASSEGGAFELLDDLGDDDFTISNVIDYQVTIKAEGE